MLCWCGSMSKFQIQYPAVEWIIYYQAVGMAHPVILEHNIIHHVTLNPLRKYT